MEIRFTLLPRDYWEFHKFAMLHVPLLQVNTLSHCCILIMTSFSLFWLYASTTSRNDMESLFLNPLIFSAVVLVWYFWQLKLKYQKLVAKTPGLVGEHSVFVHPEGIRKINAVSEKFIGWKRIEKIVEQPNYIFMLFQDQWAYVIPKRAFEHSDEATTFLMMLISYWKQAKINKK